MKSRKTVEDYLKTIAILKENGDVRAIDIVRYKKVSKPTVSVLLKDLSQEGYLYISDNYTIHLTEKGEKIAYNVIEKNEFIKNCLIAIGVDDKSAIQQACELEHSINNDTYTALKNYINNRMYDGVCE